MVELQAQEITGSYGMRWFNKNTPDTHRKVKTEDRLIMIGERYKAKQKQMREELLKKQKEEEDRILNKQKSLKRFHKSTISESQIEIRFNNYLQHYKCNHRKRLMNKQEKELSSMQIPIINSTSEKLVAKMNVIFKFELRRELLIDSSITGILIEVKCLNLVKRVV